MSIPAQRLHLIPPGFVSAVGPLKPLSLAHNPMRSGQRQFLRQCLIARGHHTSLSARQRLDRVEGKDGCIRVWAGACRHTLFIKATYRMRGILNDRQAVFTGELSEREKQAAAQGARNLGTFATKEEAIQALSRTASTVR